MKITDNWTKNTNEFEKAGVKMPTFDLKNMREKTLTNPQWVHFGGGNLYRCFHAKIAQDLLNQGLLKTGVVVAEIFNEGLIEEYKTNDNRTLSVVLKADGSIEKELIASTAEALLLSGKEPFSIQRIKEIFENQSLQFVTATITEKGYIVKGMDGQNTPQAQKDLSQKPVFENMETTMGKIATLLYSRYQKGAMPLTLISTDNFSHNGQRFKDSILTIATGWEANRLVESGFTEYLNDSSKITFPYSMIDRITPLPSEDISEELQKEGIEGMAFPVNSTFAPFVNTEETHYLVVEDFFANGRPPLEKAGVFLTDRDTVNKADLMKVCACLNPLHTSLAIFGCLLGFDRIWKEMQDQDLLELVKQLGYVEALPVAADPKIIQPKEFLDEVIHKRLVNPFIPDSPQRIATDTSQKLGVRYGETIKAYLASDVLNVDQLQFIPLTIAAWCRYLLGVDDQGNVMAFSPDPLLEELSEYFKGISLGDEIDAHKVLSPILGNEQIFGIDLYKTSLGTKIEEFFVQLIKAPGSVRNVLQTELEKYRQRLI